MKIIPKIVAGYDKFMVKIQGFKKIPGSSIGFFYIVPKVHKGKTVVLKDGTAINMNDHVFELHIINTNLSELDTSYGNLFRMIAGELTYLAEYLNLEVNQDIKGIYGVTLLHRLGKRAGFTVVDIEHPFKRKLYSFGENILRNTLSGDGVKKKNKKVEAKEVWMSRSQILASNTKIE